MATNNNNKTALERAYLYLVSTGEVKSKKDVAEKMHASNSSVVSAINGDPKYNTPIFRLRFNSAFGNVFNKEFLDNNEGEMLSHARVININEESGISLSRPNRYGDAPDAPKRWAPVVPRGMATMPDFDIIGHLRKQMTGGNVEKLYSGNLDIDMWHYIDTHALEPRYECGDCMGLKKIGSNMIVPGNLYCVDTISKGLVTAYLYYNDGGGYIARVDNPKYRDYYIPKSDVIHVYRMMIMFRYNS